MVKFYQTVEKEQVTSVMLYREPRMVESRYDGTGVNGLLRAS